MLKSIQNHFRKPKTQATHPGGQKVSASHAKFLPASNPLYVKRESPPPRYGTTYAWFLKRPAPGHHKPASARSAAQHLANEIDKQVHPAETQQRIQAALRFCGPGMRRPEPVKAVRVDPEASARQQQLVQTAVDDYVRQHRDPSAQVRGPIANLIAFARTGRPYRNAGGFDGERRNVIGERTFPTPLDATRFLLEETDLVDQLGASHPQVVSLTSLHGNLEETHQAFIKRGAGL